MDFVSKEHWSKIWNNSKEQVDKRMNKTSSYCNKYSSFSIILFLFGNFMQNHIDILYASHAHYKLLHNITVISYRLLQIYPQSKENNCQSGISVGVYSWQVRCAYMRCMFGMFWINWTGDESVVEKWWQIIQLKFSTHQTHNGNNEKKQFVYNWNCRYKC